MKIPKINVCRPYQIKPAKCNSSMTIAAARKFVKQGYIFEEKFDGLRYLLQSRPNRALINYLTSRKISKVTGKYVEKQDYCPQIRDFKFPWEDTVFDGEIVAPGISSDTQHAIVTGNVTYKCWDILMYKGQDLRELPLYRRHEYLAKLCLKFPKWMQLVPRVPAVEGAAFLDAVLARKGEGVVIKDLSAFYGEGWTKVKEVKTADVVITGYFPAKTGKYLKLGWIGSLLIAQYRNGKLFDVGRASGFNEELRQEFTNNPKKYIGVPIEVEFQLRLPSGKFRHPRFKRFRYDKNAEECIFDGAK